MPKLAEPNDLAAVVHPALVVELNEAQRIVAVIFNGIAGTNFPPRLSEMGEIVLRCEITPVRRRFLDLVANDLVRRTANRDRSHERERDYQYGQFHRFPQPGCIPIISKHRIRITEAAIIGHLATAFLRVCQHNDSGLNTDTMMTKAAYCLLKIMCCLYLMELRCRPHSPYQNNTLGA